MRHKSTISGVLAPALVLIVGTAAALMVAMTPVGGGHSSKLPPWWTRDSHTGPPLEHYEDHGTVHHRNQDQRQQAQLQSAPGCTWAEHGTADRVVDPPKLRSNLLMLTAIIAAGSRHSTNP
jgi:hypothetical protein